MLQVVTERAVSGTPRLQFVPAYGYVSLFPLLMQLLPADAPELGQQVGRDRLGSPGVCRLGRCAWRGCARGVLLVMPRAGSRQQEGRGGRCWVMPASRGGACCLLPAAAARAVLRGWPVWTASVDWPSPSCLAAAALAARRSPCCAMTACCGRATGCARCRRPAACTNSERLVPRARLQLRGFLGAPPWAGWAPTSPAGCSCCLPPHTLACLPP